MTDRTTTYCVKLSCGRNRWSTFNTADHEQFLHEGGWLETPVGWLCPNHVKEAALEAFLRSMTKDDWRSYVGPYGTGVPFGD